MHKDSNALNWFEIPVNNFDRAKKFYETIFDFQMSSEKVGTGMMGFFPSYTGKISGAIIQGKGYVSTTDGVKLYLNCNPDLSIVLAKVVSAGGNITVPKTQIAPELGHFAFINDSEGNTIGLHSQN
jgi:uncharacterized protein